MNRLDWGIVAGLVVFGLAYLIVIGVALWGWRLPRAAPAVEDPDADPRDLAERDFAAINRIRRAENLKDFERANRDWLQHG